MEPLTTSEIIKTLDKLDFGFFAINSNWEFTYLNDEAVRFFLKEKSELLGKNVWEVFPEKIGSLSYQLYHKAMQEQKIMRFESFSPRGTSWYEVRVHPFPEGLLIYCHNISWFKRAEDQIKSILFEATKEQALLASSETSAPETIYRELQWIIARTMAEGVCLVRMADNSIIYANPKFQTMFGYAPGELDNQPARTLIYAETPLKAEEIVKQLTALVLQTGEATYEVHNIKKDGTSFWCQATTSLFEHPEYGTILVAVHQDISEQKRAEDNLRKSEERYRSVVMTLTEGIIFQTTDSKTLTCNASAERILGLTREQMLGISPIDAAWQAIKEDGTPFPIHEQPAQITLATGQPCSNVIMGIYKPDETLTWLSVNSQPLFHPATSELYAVVTSFSDITEPRKLAQEILKTTKLEALGVLAGGIAHDFNNLLTGIIGNIGLAKLSDSLNSETGELLEEVEQAALRSKELTQQLLTFAKGGAPIKKLSRLENLIQQSASFVVRGTNVRLEFDLPQTDWQVELDEGQISQVIQNIVLNAVQAMPQGGTVSLKTENIPATGKPSLNSAQATNYVRLAIQDQGQGIAPENLARIFDPYFTTKDGGNGLGLAVCYSIVRKHDGYIEVKSELGKGTTFFVYLPAVVAHIEKPATEPVEKLVGGLGRILLMDDEQMLLQLGSRVLKRLGYEVEVASDGEEALRRYEQALAARRPFNAVMLDLTIPGGMGGKETISKLLQIDPSVKAIVCSGYSNDPVMANYQQFGFQGVLAKPYRVEELSRIVHRVIS